MYNFIDLLELFDGSRSVEVRQIYEVFGTLLRRVVDEHTRESQQQFSGLFAQLEYLLTDRLSASEPFVRRVHDLRSRIRKAHTMAQEQLQHHCLYDLRTLCEFVSLLTGETIPDDLQSRFPRGQYETHGVRVSTDCMRVVVQSFDDHFILARVDGEGSDVVRVCYDAGNSELVGEAARFSMGDWTYLRPLLAKNVQLNLVHPRWVGNCYVAELIVFEPDSLVNISAIAACFESYAQSPMLDVLNKLKPNASTEATVLGNLASQMLDEELRSTDEERPYVQTVKEFFRYNALSLASLGQLSATFHTEAQHQRQNIHRAISGGLAEVSAFEQEKAIVEPSFFCEMLGLQGRMDLLQTDYRVVVEQKSGKSEFPVNPEHIRPQEKHFVQLLLYQAVLHYQFHLRNDEISAFLLYSKYPKGLVRTGAAPAKLFDAMRLRNEMVANELVLASDKGAALLQSLTPGMFCQRPVSPQLWRNYVEPQLRELLSPIHQASPLERDYYCRFMRFLTVEHLQAKLGNRTKECSGFASAWNATLEEKRLAGNIYDDLTITALRTQDQAIVGVELRPVRTTLVDTVEPVEPLDGMASPSSDFLPNFRRGDIVVLYSYQQDAVPDVRQTMVIRASIADIDGETVTLHLRAPQTHRIVFEQKENMRWAIEHDFMEASFTALYRGMHTFLSASKRRRDLILAQRTPEMDAKKTLKGDYGPFNELVLQAKQACDYFLLIGPPGTGKTSFGLLNILLEQLGEPSTNVLLLSYTNRAVDEICSKLVERGIDFIRVGSALSCADEYKKYLLSSQMDVCRNVEEVRSLVQRQRVFVGTTTALGGKQSLFELKHFDLAIIDEASQILEPHLMPLLCAKHGKGEAIDKFVLIGDHKQLPAVVQQSQEQSRVEEDSLRSIGLTNCRNSLFERWLHIGPHYLLTRQGRMHTAIADFPNQAFYEGKLQPVPLPHQVEEGGQRVFFIPATRPTHAVSDKVNVVEADIIADLVLQVYAESDRFDPLRTVGVIVPYRNQILAVRKAIQHKLNQLKTAQAALKTTLSDSKTTRLANGQTDIKEASSHSQEWGSGWLESITIDTVERFQGSQREVIIYGFTIQKPYQLQFLTDNVFEENGQRIDRKLNVVMTRAMRRLYLVGNPALLRLDPIFCQLLAFPTKEDLKTRCDAEKDVS